MHDGSLRTYAQDLRHVLHAIEGHFVSGYTDGSDAPGRQLRLVPGTLEEARAFRGDKVDTQERFESVSDRADGFESPFGLELLSTFHWTAENEAATHDLDEIQPGTYRYGTSSRTPNRARPEPTTPSSRTNSVDRGRS